MLVARICTYAIPINLCPAPILLVVFDWGYANALTRWNIVILETKIVEMTIFGAANDENFVKISLLFQCLAVPGHNHSIQIKMHMKHTSRIYLIKSCINNGRGGFSQPFYDEHLMKLFICCFLYSITFYVNLYFSSLYNQCIQYKSCMYT